MDFIVLFYNKIKTKAQQNINAHKKSHLGNVCGSCLHYLVWTKVSMRELDELKNLSIITIYAPLYILAFICNQRKTLINFCICVYNWAIFSLVWHMCLTHFGIFEHTHTITHVYACERTCVCVGGCIGVILNRHGEAFLNPQPGRSQFIAQKQN